MNEKPSQAFIDTWMFPVFLGLLIVVIIIGVLICVLRGIKKKGKKAADNMSTPTNAQKKASADAS